MSSLSLKYSQFNLRWFLEPCRPSLQSRYRGRECREDVMVYIPEHQRDFVWKLKKQQALIHTVFRGYPIPAVIATQDERNRYSIQDGQQRLETFWRYYTNLFPVNEKFWKDLTDVEQKVYLDYQIPMIDITGASIDEESEIYDLMNQGMALSHGEKFWNRRSRPLVKLTEELFLKRGEGLNTTLVDVFGDYLSAKDPRHNNMANAIAYVAGAAYGSTYISTSYQKLASIVNRSDLIDRNLVERRLKEVFRIYKAANDKQPLMNSKKSKSQWKIGLYSCYILHSYLQHEDDIDSWQAIRDTWIEFLVRSRRNPRTADLLYNGMPSIQANISIDKLERGYQNILSMARDGFGVETHAAIEHDSLDSEDSDNYDSD